MRAKAAVRSFRSQGGMILRVQGLSQGSKDEEVIGWRV